MQEKIKKEKTNYDDMEDDEYHENNDDYGDERLENEEGDDEHNANGIVSQLIHFRDILFQKHSPAVRLRKHPPHQQHISSQMR